MSSTSPKIARCPKESPLRFKPLLKLAAVGLALMSAAATPSTAQTAIKTNLLGDALVMPNISGEVSLSNHSTIALNLRYAPVALAEKFKYKHWAVAPEYRYWFFAPFRRWYVGGELFGGQYNAAGLPFYGLKRKRKQGSVYGAAVTGGFAWQLSPRWNLEAGIGIGVGGTRFDKYDYGDCGYPWGKKNGAVVGVTQIGVTLSYIIRKR